MYIVSVYLLPFSGGNYLANDLLCALSYFSTYLDVRYSFWEAEAVRCNGVNPEFKYGLGLRDGSTQYNRSRDRNE